MTEKLPAAPSPPAKIGSLFHQHWWLDAVAPGDWDEKVETDSSGRVVGRLPYVIKKRSGLILSRMPPLTHALGPIIDIDEGGKAQTRREKEFFIVNKLIAALPKADSVYQLMDGDYTIPFLSAGFRVGVLPTIQFSPTTPLDDVWKGMNAKLRNDIRNVQQCAQIVEGKDPKEFAQFYIGSMEARGVSSYYESPLLVRIYEACKQRGQCRITMVVGPAGRKYAGAFFAWDDNFVYYLLGCRDAGGQRGALSWLLWDGIARAGSNNRVLVETVTSRSRWKSLCDYGGVIVPRFIVQKESLQFGIVHTFRDWSRNRFWSEKSIFLG